MKKYIGCCYVQDMLIVLFAGSHPLLEYMYSFLAQLAPKEYALDAEKALERKAPACDNFVFLYGPIFLHVFRRFQISPDMESVRESAEKSSFPGHSIHGAIAGL